MNRHDPVPQGRDILPSMRLTKKMTAVTTLSLIISLLALIVSATTMWLTLFYRGELRMTHPSVIYFGPDGGKTKKPKVFLKSLMYSTSKKGFLIETLFVKVK